MSATNQAVTDESGPSTLEDKVAELDELRDRKRELNSELKEIDERFRALEAEIINDLDSQGVEMSRTSRASVSISEQTYPTATDWDAVWTYARDNDRPELFQRRLAAGACQELWQSGEDIPGAEPVTKRSLNLRKNR
jgi:hypothetical protein